MGKPDLHIWPDLMPRTQPAEMYAELAQKYYEAGADGFVTWDGERRTQRLSEWAAVRRLGHRDELDYHQEPRIQIFTTKPCWKRWVDSPRRSRSMMGEAIVLAIKL